MIIFKCSELQISLYFQMHAQKEIFPFFEREENFSLAEDNQLSIQHEKNASDNYRIQKNPVHIYIRLYYLFRVAISFNEITNVELMDYIVNSLNISNFSCVNMAEKYIYI